MTNKVKLLLGVLPESPQRSLLHTVIRTSHQTLGHHESWLKAILEPFKIANTMAIPSCKSLYSYLCYRRSQRDNSVGWTGRASFALLFRKPFWVSTSHNNFKYDVISFDVVTCSWRTLIYRFVDFLRWGMQRHRPSDVFLKIAYKWDVIKSWGWSRILCFVTFVLGPTSIVSDIIPSSSEHHSTFLVSTLYATFSKPPSPSSLVSSSGSFPVANHDPDWDAMQTCRTEFRCRRTTYSQYALLNFCNLWVTTSRFAEVILNMAPELIVRQTAAARRSWQTLRASPSIS